MSCLLGGQSPSTPWGQQWAEGRRSTAGAAEEVPIPTLVPGSQEPTWNTGYSSEDVKLSEQVQSRPWSC